MLAEFIGLAVALSADAAADGAAFPAVGGAAAGGGSAFFEQPAKTARANATVPMFLKGFLKNSFMFQDYLEAGRIRLTAVLDLPC
jgi:hypothetical protein